MKCFWNPGYYVPLPDNHPFPVEKYPRLVDVLKHSDLASCLQFELAPKVSREQVLTVHTAEYLQLIESGTLPLYHRNRLGLPHHPRWLDRSFLDVGGTLAAARTALQEGIAWNLGGGTHHAMPDEGLGFCVLNDVAVSISAIREANPSLRILVLDTDAHQGNGNHRILRGTPGVFTFSIHVGANYPAVKEPGDLDVGLPRYVRGDVYLSELERALFTISERFHPDLVFWVSGVDVLAGDKFGQMNLSLQDMADRDYMVLKAVEHWDAALVGTLGGGYPENRVGLPSLHSASVLRSLEFRRC